MALGCSTKQHWISEEHYLVAELLSKIKHEFVDGQVYAMADASANHGRIVSTVVRMLGNQLMETPYDVFAADMKVKASRVSFIQMTSSIAKARAAIVIFTETTLIIVKLLSHSICSTDQTLKVHFYQICLHCRSMC